MQLYPPTIDPMRIVSIDVGIKNLAICVFSLQLEPNSSTCGDGTTVASNKPTIERNEIDIWDVINLAQKEVSKCSGREKDGSPCGREARFTKHGICFCLCHSNKEPYLRPSRELEAVYLKKQKVPRLHEIAEKHCVLYTNPIKKADLIAVIVKHGTEKCFEVVDKVNANNLDIVTIGRNIHYKLDILFDNSFDDISLVLIENQISPIANRMKTIQGMLSQYFLMKNGSLDIDFVSSMNKLKDDILVENSYSERKKMGIAKCLGIIKEDFTSWVDFFNKHKKNDDLADCFLQGMWYIRAKM